MSALRPFLLRSAAGHGGLLLLLAWAGRGGLRKPEPVYQIDFIGTSSAVLNRSREALAPGAPAPLPPKAAPQSDPDAFSLLKPKRPLPKPSVLSAPIAPAPAAPTTPAPVPGGGREGEKARPGGEGAADVAPDMPNFPYPWYLTQLRAALWERWSARMPAQEGECGVVFSVLRGGGAVDLRVELASGDAAFDYLALSAVRESSPFAPLPRGFAEPHLKIHVRFKARP